MRVVCVGKTNDEAVAHNARTIGKLNTDENKTYLAFEVDCAFLNERWFDGNLCGHSVSSESQF
jgi:hypothetical protein